LEETKREDNWHILASSSSSGIKGREKKNRRCGRKRGPGGVVIYVK